MQTLSPWATKPYVDTAREAQKAGIAALREDLQAILKLLTELRDRRPWGRLRWALGRKRW